MRGWRKVGNPALVLVVVLIGALASGEADARGGKGGRAGGRSGGHHSSAQHSGGHHSGAHHSVKRGHHFGGTRIVASSFIGIFPYSLPYARMTPTEPVYYIEKSEEELQSQDSWFFCEGAGAYYPYVNQCPGGWVRVAPMR